MATQKRNKARLDALSEAASYVDLNLMLTPVLAARWRRMSVSPLTDAGDYMACQIYGHRSDSQVFFVSVKIPKRNLVDADTFEMAADIVREYVKTGMSDMLREYSYCGCRGGDVCRSHSGTRFASGEDNKKVDGSGGHAAE